MRTGHLKSLSERDRQGMREFRQFVADEAQKQRDAEDRAEYERHCATLAQDYDDGDRIPSGLKLKPPSFEEFQRLMPDDRDPVVRGVIATNKSLQNEAWRTAQKQVGGTLEDRDLERLGFDLSVRPAPYSGAQLVSPDGNEESLGKIYAEFVAATPGYDHALHWDALAGFFQRNRLSPTLHNLKLAWSGLTALALAPEKPPAPERDPGLNQYGVRMEVEPDPELERRKARERYRTEIVLTDVETGKSWTQFQIDNCMDATTFKRLFLGKFRTPVVGDVIKGTVK